MSTNYETNLEIEAALEQVHKALYRVQALAAIANPRSVPHKLLHKIDFLDTKLATIREIMGNKVSAD